MKTKSTTETIFDRARANVKLASQELAGEIKSAGGIDVWRAQQAAKPVKVDGEFVESTILSADIGVPSITVLKRKGDL